MDRGLYVGANGGWGWASNFNASSTSSAGITETLGKVEAAGFSEVILYFNVGLKAHNQVKEEMERFMREVAPAFEGAQKQRAQHDFRVCNTRSVAVTSGCSPRTGRCAPRALRVMTEAAHGRSPRRGYLGTQDAGPNSDA